MKQAVYNRLQELSIDYEVTEHAPVFTIAEMLEIGLEGDICKNLFIRDAKGKRHFLIVTTHDQTINLAQVGEKLNIGKVSFASPQRLEKYLGVTTGAVSPFGIINDTEKHVVVILDSKLKGSMRLGIHPNDNSATVWISWDNLISFIESQANDFDILTL